MTNKTKLDFDPNYKPLTPTLVLSETIPGTDQTIVAKYYGSVDRATAKKDLKYRAEQLAPAPVRQRRERTTDRTSQTPFVVREVLDAAPDTARRKRRRHDDAYAAA